MGRQVEFWHCFIGLVILSAGCAPAPAATLAPTLTLVPPTPTHTPTPVTPTVTRVVLPGPADLVSATPQPVVQRIPAAAQPLLQRALDDLSARLAVEQDAIRLLRLEAAVWTGGDLGCEIDSPQDERQPETEGFRFVLEAQGQVYIYHTDQRDTVRLCQEIESTLGRAEDLLLEIDPVAVEMVALAQRRLADRLGLSLQRIQLVDVMPMTWTDSSLGCPQAGQIYPPVTIEGYRIVLMAGAVEYIYHSDSTQVLACAASDERLPTPSSR